ncbi:MAG: nitrous oxide reductase family maturation protein NosD [Anaerolineae bacterium]|nr:nitrous oxide reductase family maturation protein NosD [Anaerolineae bacterium]MDW8098661.1 nitrous oxide reductase family maturation protein NosD [Anaerolineae bacterium]
MEWPLRLTLSAWILLCWLWPAPVLAALGPWQPLVVSPQGPYTTLTEALAVAQDGDTIEVHGGSYSGPLTVDRRLALIGYNWPVIDGGGRGTVVKLAASGIVFRGFVVRNSGDSLEEENSGIAVEAPEVVVEGNRLEGTLFGIYLSRAHGSLILGNMIQSKDLPLPRRGDAIRIWYSDGVRIEGNTVERGRDAVLWYSEGLVLRGNTLRGGRYGLHFMYCDDALIEGNVITDNSVGVFLMYSRRLHLRRNILAHNRGPSGYGIGLKDMDDVVIEENLLLDNRVGAFLDNSPREIESIGLFRQNVFAFNDIGISLLPSVRRNHFVENSFMENQEQVDVAGGGQLEGDLWTVDGRGNYWSDYAGFDADGDGVGDVPYRAERLFESLMGRHPELRLFLYSPAAQAVDFAARAFPLVKPQPKLTDDRPLMAPVIPEGLPALPQPSRQPLGIASVGLLAVTATLTLLARRTADLLLVRRSSPIIRYPQSEREAMVHVRDLTKRFGPLVAVDRLSFEVMPGEAVALWGPNGAGKTTALRCLLGLLPFEGLVRVGGYEVTLQGKEVRRIIGFVPQELNFYDDLAVRETLCFYARLKKAPLERVDEALERIGLTRHAYKPVKDLSGGMKQRLALAVALLADPPLLVLDEPTANLDARSRQELLAWLGELKAAGKTLIFSSHRLSEVAKLADRVLVLEDGRLVTDCLVREWMESRGRRSSGGLRSDIAGYQSRMASLEGTADTNGTGMVIEQRLLQGGEPG